MYIYEGITGNEPRLQPKKEIYIKSKSGFLNMIVQRLEGTIISGFRKSAMLLMESKRSVHETHYKVDSV